MKRLLYALLALLFVGCVADFDDKSITIEGKPSSEKIVNGSDGAQKGVLLVRFDASAESRLAQCATRSGATRTGVQGVDALLDEVEGCGVEPIFVVTEKNRDKVYSRGLHLWYELRFDEEQDLDSVAAKLAEVGEVQIVEFSHNLCRVGDATITPISQTASRADVRSVSSDKDPYYAYQWSLNNLGSASRVQVSKEYPDMPSVQRGADINMLPAWKLCKGDPSIIVAVVDEGVMYNHEDLANNVWTNSGEIAGDGIDNDGNGYIDDIHGYNFVRLSNNITWNEIKDTGHGTHVAGIIAAENNNGKGIMGIAGGDDKTGGVKIMSVQICANKSYARVKDTARGIQYAADNGAHILQNSWGYQSGLKNSDMPKNDTEYRLMYRLEAEAIDYFVAPRVSGDNSPMDGGVVIFAAVNDGVALPGYPAAYRKCVAVAAHSPSLRPSYYTCYGIGTDIVAPGGEVTYVNGGILSTVPERFDDPSIAHYALMQGTSQACPHVSGVAALGLSYAKKLGKRYTADEFRSMLLSATNDIEPYLIGYVPSIRIDYTKYSNQLGNGYIDAYKLLLQIDGTPYSIVGVGSSEIDLAPFFGDGVHTAELSKIVISDEDREAIGLGDCLFNNGKLSLSCDKSGVATISLTLFVGGGSLDNTTRPFPVEVTKTFVLMVKGRVASNGGWL